MPSLSQGARVLGAWLRAAGRAHLNNVVVALATSWPDRLGGAGGTAGFEQGKAGRRKRKIGRGNRGARAAQEVCGWWKRDGLTVDRCPGTWLKWRYDAVVL